MIALDADELSFMLLGRRSIDLQRDLDQAGPDRRWSSQFVLASILGHRERDEAWLRCLIVATAARQQRQRGECPSRRSYACHQFLSHRGSNLLRRDAAGHTEAGSVVGALGLRDGREERRAEHDRPDETRPNVHVISLRLDRTLRSHGRQSRPNRQART